MTYELRKVRYSDELFANLLAEAADDGLFMFRLAVVSVEADLGSDYDVDPIGSHLEQSSYLPPKLVQTITSANFRGTR